MLGLDLNGTYHEETKWPLTFRIQLQLSFNSHFHLQDTIHNQDIVLDFPHEN